MKQTAQASSMARPAARVSSARYAFFSATRFTDPLRFSFNAVFYPRESICETGA